MTWHCAGQQWSGPHTLGQRHGPLVMAPVTCLSLRKLGSTLVGRRLQRRQPVQAGGGGAGADPALHKQ